MGSMIFDMDTLIFRFACDIIGGLPFSRLSPVNVSAETADAFSAVQDSYTHSQRLIGI
jgi:hypothetical protein